MKIYMLVLISVLLLFVISASPVMAETIRPDVDVDVQPGQSVSVDVTTPSGRSVNIAVSINNKAV